MRHTDSMELSGSVPLDQPEPEVLYAPGVMYDVMYAYLSKPPRQQIKTVPSRLTQQTADAVNQAAIDQDLIPLFLSRDDAIRAVANSAPAESATKPGSKFHKFGSFLLHKIK